MSDYQAPIRSMRFIIDDVIGIDTVTRLPGFEDATGDLVAAILDEAGKFAGEVLGPLNRVGDSQGCSVADGVVTLPDGWKEAYAGFCAGGWTTVSAPTEFGGQHMPKLLAAAVTEMWQSANLSFSLLPMLSSGAAEALLIAGSPELKAKYLPKMVSGEWSGTMNLTEPQAGSDLAAIRARAEPVGDGSYRVFGQKIFITYGEHEIAGNIVHLVLARLPDAPPGVRGISLFVVPKYLVNDDGTPGARNDVYCVSTEHKLGIHASPTCVMAFGDHGGAIGELVGAPNRGLETMFIMMNEARFGVGQQGVAIAERAFQQALAYAGERLQGRDLASGQDNAPILAHPDVRRMLLQMQSRTQAARMLSYWVAAQFDIAHADADPLRREAARRHVDLLIPVVKGWSTEIGNESTYLGVQVHGGMGFIEETGAAQHMRDARILTIYEGTTGIQANDLLTRKLLRDSGESFMMLTTQMRADVAGLAAAGNDQALAMAARIGDLVELFDASARRLLTLGKQDLPAALAVAAPFLMLAGTVCGAWMWGKAALAATQRLARDPSDAEFCGAQLELAGFYLSHVAPQATAHAATVADGARHWNAPML